MPQYYDTLGFLAMKDLGLPLLDARSPAEFERAHIPGAVNLPVLDNDERATVGTAHAQSGQEGAIHVALTLIGPHLAGKLARARHLFQEHLDTLKDKPEDTSAPGEFTANSLRKSRDILLHCWRGGMRSSSLAWLLELGGFRVHVLRGGYKAYRAQVRSSLSTPPQGGVLVLGGMTGSGKTAILHELAAYGSQVIDLEYLAGHRGSAFGSVGLQAQPLSESVENALHEQWRKLAPNRPVWMEDEDRRIGSVALCEGFFEHIRTGHLVMLNVPFDARVHRLVREYTHPTHATLLPGPAPNIMPNTVPSPSPGGKEPDSEAVSVVGTLDNRVPDTVKAELAASINRLRPRLGDERATQTLNNLDAGRYPEAVAEVLRYYDKLYTRQIQKHARHIVQSLNVDDTPEATAQQLALWEKAQRGKFC